METGSLRAALSFLESNYFDNSGQRHIGPSVQTDIGEALLLESRESRSGNHRGVIRGQTAVWKEDLDSAAAGVRFERGAEFTIRGNAARYQNDFDATFFGSGQAAIDQIAHDSSLKFPD